LYFNRAIDVNLLSVQVRETLHGQTYINNDPLGVDFIDATGFTLTDVNRDLVPVLGRLELIPGSAAIAFYPERNFGFNADLFVEASYEGAELSRTRFKIRALPTFINGAIADQFGQPLAGIVVELPELSRKAVTNGDGGFAFGYQESGEDIIAAGRYQLKINTDFANPRFGTTNTTISVQQNNRNNLERYSLQELDSSVPFQNLVSGRLNSLAGGDLLLDLSHAEALFSVNTNGTTTSRTSGAIHTQFLPFEHIGADLWPGAAPHWVFSSQPKGITIEGDVALTMTIPPLFGSYDYINPEFYKYVLLLGYNITKEVIEPIGVGRIEGTRVVSVGSVNLTSLDYVGYTQLTPGSTDILERYASGELSLAELIAALPRQ
jgi:hypothetical protein